MFEVLTDERLILDKLNEFRPNSRANNYKTFDVYSRLMLIWADDFSELFDVQKSEGLKDEMIKVVTKALGGDSDSTDFIKKAMSVPRKNLEQCGKWDLVSNDLTGPNPNILFGILKDSD